MHHCTPKLRSIGNLMFCACKSRFSAFSVCSEDGKVNHTVLSLHTNLCKRTFPWAQIFTALSTTPIASFGESKMSKPSST